MAAHTGGTVPSVRLRLAFTSLLLAATLAPAGAHAQSLEDELNQQAQEAVQGGDVTTEESPATPGVVPDEADVPAEEDPAPEAPATIETPGIDPDADLASGTTPVPPPYLTAGPSAELQPVSAVAAITEPEVSLPPLRTAALIAPALALLLLAAAGILRATGVRTAAHEPVDTAPAKGASRLGDATRQIADDMRDFLRRSR